MHEDVPAPRPRVGRTGSNEFNIGRSVIIKGEMTGSEDLTIEGQFEGRIELKDNVLTIGQHGRIKADVFAKAVQVRGRVNGTIGASDAVSILEQGAVDGDIKAPRVAIADGAHFRGSVDMNRDKADSRDKAAPSAHQPPAKEPSRTKGMPPAPTKAARSHR